MTSIYDTQALLLLALIAPLANAVPALWVVDVLYIHTALYKRTGGVLSLTYP
jgi:hypothetical protein